MKKKHRWFHSYWFLLLIYFCISVLLAILLIPPRAMPVPYDIHVDGVIP